MTPQKVVLMDVNGVELTKGPYSQGVVIEQREEWTGIYDVASRQEISRQIGAYWYTHEPDTDTLLLAGPYARVFVQSYSPASEAERLSA